MAISMSWVLVSIFGASLFWSFRIITDAFGNVLFDDFGLISLLWMLARIFPIFIAIALPLWFWRKQKWSLKWGFSLFIVLIVPIATLTVRLLNLDVLFPPSWITRLAYVGVLLAILMSLSLSYIVVYFSLLYLVFFLSFDFSWLMSSDRVEVYERFIVFYLIFCLMMFLPEICRRLVRLRKA